MANILPHQILSHISALPGEVQEAATEVINIVTSMPDNRDEDKVRSEGGLGLELPALPLLKCRCDVSPVPEAYLCPKEIRMRIRNPFNAQE